MPKSFSIKNYFLCSQNYALVEKSTKNTGEHYAVK